MITSPSTQFERTTCGRCGGSGQHSFCEMYGSRCFGCAGSGKVLTKRGKAALAWYNTQRTVKVADVKIGDRIETSGMKFTVREIGERKQVGTSNGVPWFGIELSNAGGADGTKQRMGYVACEDGTVLRLPKTEAERVAWLRAAFAYQDTLTKCGKPARRPA